jgi:hypothetical protein
MNFDDWKRDMFVEKEAVEKVEADNLYPDDGRVPHVPFGFSHDKWLQFRRQMQPGDELYYYETSAESWRNLAGRSGYILVRDGEVIDNFGTMMN